MIRPVTAVAATVLLYGALALGANSAVADGLDADAREAIAELREGTLDKLVIHDEAREFKSEAFVDGNGGPVTMADFEGKVVLLNFWATWCPPCRAEMPSIDRLSGELGGEDFHVVALSLDRGHVGRIEKFFGEIAVEHLAIYQDAKNKTARSASILGLPVTVILDREGQEIARLTGDAEWDSESAKAIVAHVIEATSSGAERAEVSK
ncbi:MAG: TlpA disulfide reductase family protein [Pseudomonadota bacterium]